MKINIRMLTIIAICTLLDSCSKQILINKIIGNYLCTIDYHSWQRGPDYNSTNTDYAFHTYDSTNATHPDVFEISKGSSVNEISFRNQPFTLTKTINKIAYFNVKGAPSGLGDRLEFNLKSHELTFYAEYTDHYLQKGYSYYYYGKKIK